MEVSFLQRPITVCIIFFTTPCPCQGSSLLILVSQMISSCKIIILSSRWWSYPYHVIAPNPKRTQRAMLKQRAKNVVPNWSIPWLNESEHKFIAIAAVTLTKIVDECNHWLCQASTNRRWSLLEHFHFLHRHIQNCWCILDIP